MQDAKIPASRQVQWGSLLAADRRLLGQKPVQAERATAQHGSHAGIGPPGPGRPIEPEPLQGRDLLPQNGLVANLPADWIQLL